MDPVSALVGVVIGGLIAAGFVYVQLAKAKADLSASKVRAEESDRLSKEVDELKQQLATRGEELQAKNLELNGIETRFDEQSKNLEEQRLTIEKAEQEFKDAFEALAAKTLKGSQAQFVEMAKEVLTQHTEGAKGDLEKRQLAIDEMLKPMEDRLKEIDEQNLQMERRRSTAYGELLEQVKALGTQQAGLQKETSRLVKALQDPGSAGSWGEMVLERVLEMAGLEKDIHFTTQETIEGENGQQRPDVIVKMPGDRVLIIDSKAPMRQYLDALEKDDVDLKKPLLLDHAKKLLDHAKALSKRKYSDLAESPDFTVMFVPSESAFRSAVEQLPSLIEDAMDIKVLVATPTTLLGLMKAVAFGWQQDKLAQNMKKVQEEGRRLYESVATLADHYGRLGKALNNAGQHYNKLGASLDTRVLPAARRFKEQGVSTQKEIEQVEPSEFTPRPLQSPELTPGALPFED